MDGDRIYLYASLLLAPISSAITWFVGRKTRKAGEIIEIQKTIDMLLEHNQNLTAEVIRLQREMVKMKRDYEELLHKIKKYENDGNVQDKP